MMTVDYWAFQIMEEYIKFMKFSPSEEREIRISMTDKIKKLPCDELMKMFTDLEYFMIQQKVLQPKKC